MMFSVYASSLSHEGRSHKCRIHPHVRERMHASERVHLHVRKRMHASETPYIFSLSRPTENDILIVKLKVTQIDGGLGTKS